MTTYTKETALYDTGAIAGDIQEAGAQVNKYITAIGDEGIKVHPYDATQGQADTDNYAKIDSDGMEIWQKPTGASASVKVAKFGADGAQIGQDGKTHANVYSNSLELTDSSDTTFFKVRDAVNESGKVTDTFSGDGEKTEWTLSYYASNTSYTVTQNDTTVSPTKTNTQITFSTPPAVGDIIVVVYNTVGNSAKAYDLGIRKTNTISGSYSVIEGITTTASGSTSHAEGHTTTASGPSSHAEGMNTTASETCSHAEGYRTTASGEYSHAEGYKTKASGLYSHAEGDATTASGQSSHAEGVTTTASGSSSHAEGYRTTASGSSSHAEGYRTTASEYGSHAEGDGTTASRPYSHAEGYSTTASGSSSHAEGRATTASGEYSHAEGWNTYATKSCSHAEGRDTKAEGFRSHASGFGTIANLNDQMVIGRYNLLDPGDGVYPIGSKYAFIIGNGEDPGDGNIVRSNALTVDWDGNVKAAGGVIINKTDTAQKDLTYVNEYVRLAANQTASESAGQLKLSTSNKSCLIANKYDAIWSDYMNECVSVTDGVVTILKSGRYRFDYQVYFYNGFTANDIPTCGIGLDGLNGALLRASRFKTTVTNPYTTLSGSYIGWGEKGHTFHLMAQNSTDARGVVGLSEYTRLTITCLMTH